jgi:hypothetical protein
MMPYTSGGRALVSSPQEHLTPACTLGRALQSVHFWSSQASAQVTRVLPGVSTLVLRDCIIPAAHLQPLLAGGPVTCVRLEGNSDLSNGSSSAGQGLLDLLSLTPSLTSLELTGVTQRFRPAAAILLGTQGVQGAPAGEPEGTQAGTTSQLPTLSTSIKRLSLTCSGSLQACAPVLHRLPALECLEVATSPGAPEQLPYLPDILPTFSTVKTLHLPDVTISGGRDGAVLRALLQMPALQDVQVCMEDQEGHISTSSKGTLPQPPP